MTCQRCHGLCIQERDHCWVYWRCVGCGDQFDSTVMENRWLYRELKMLEFELSILRGSPA